jgi:putative ABC transport system permease protein
VPALPTVPVVQVLEGVRIALGSLRENKLRTFLTLLGNIVGTMSVIAVVSLIDGIDKFARQEVAEEGSNIFAIERVNDFDFLTDQEAFIEAIRRNPRLTLDDVEHLETRIPHATHVVGRLRSAARVQFDERNLGGVGIVGYSADYDAVEKYPIASGRHFTRLEVRHSKPVAVIGSIVAETLFPARDPLGRTIKVAGRHLTVIGVVAEKGKLLGDTRDKFVLTPITTFRKLFGPQRSVAVTVKVADIGDMALAIDEARAAMRVRHRLRPGDRDDFGIITSQLMIDLWNKISRAVFRALIFIVSISLVVGGIVLMNVMLVSVTERTREIGIRKAIGASSANILLQFLFESITLSMTGGLLGILLGFGIAAAIAALSPLPYAVKLWAIASGLVTTFIIGVVFGTYPAGKAARLDPVEALRHE